MAGEVRTINLALQGGGAHGAFTWGVLDRLLAHGGVAIEGISGTSAGAMNAAVLAYGLARGGNDGARAALRQFWSEIGKIGQMSPLRPGPIDRWLGTHNMDFSPVWLTFEAMTRVFSPYQLNPANYNPLAQVLERVVDFPWLAEQCAAERIKLFLCASNVKTGKIKVFEGTEISAKAVLASACLPFLFQAVEIDGESYWDGGYMGNPPIFPLIYGTECEDVLLVRLNPVAIDRVPVGAQEIMDRINTLSFNSSLMREMRAIDFVTRLIDDGHLPRGRYKRLNVHGIDAEPTFRQLGVSSKLNAQPEFLDELFRLGEARAAAWLDEHLAKVGVESTLDVEAFL